MNTFTDYLFVATMLVMLGYIITINARLKALRHTIIGAALVQIRELDTIHGAVNTGILDRFCERFPETDQSVSLADAAKIINRKEQPL